MENRCQSRTLFPNCQLKMKTKTCRDPKDFQALFRREPLKDMLQQRRRKLKTRTYKSEALNRENRGVESRQTRQDEGFRELQKW